MTHPQIFGKKFTPICRFSAWNLTHSSHTSLIWPNMGVAPLGATTSLPRGKLIINWSQWIYLNSFCFCTDCYREWIFYWEIYLSQGNFCVLFTWRKVILARLVTWGCTMGNHPLEVALGQGQIHVNIYRRQSMHRGKVDPGVSDLLRGNELSGGMWTGPKRLFPTSRGKFLEDERKCNLPPGNYYIKTNLHTVFFRKIAKNNGEHKSPPVHTLI